MAEASKNSSKPITTATFLKQLAEGNLTLDSLSKPSQHDESGDKIIIPTQCKPDVVELEKLTEPLTPSPGKNSPTHMENLSDSDLQTLLQNFKDLSTDEQHNLINYLKKMEAHEPERVERLRKFVNLDTSLKAKDERDENSSDGKAKMGKESPFSNRMGSLNPMVDDTTKIESDEEDMDDKETEEEKPPKPEEKENEKEKSLESEDEDYTFEDVAKAASKNVKQKELEVTMKVVKDSMEFDTKAKAKTDSDLSSAKALISNLMSNISKSNANSSIDLLGLGKSVPQSTPTSTSSILASADFAKTLSSINMANLASIVSNVKKMNPVDGPRERPLNFEPPSPVRNKLNFDPASLMRPQSPRHMDFMGQARGAAPMRAMPNMGYDDLRRDMPHAPMRDMGPLRDGLGRDMSFDPSMRDIGMGGPAMDRNFSQYPRNQPYAANYVNYPPMQPQQQQQFGGVGPRQGFEPRRMDNPRFGGNMGQPFNGRPGGGGYNNRW